MQHGVQRVAGMVMVVVCMSMMDIIANGSASIHNALRELVQNVRCIHRGILLLVSSNVQCTQTRFCIIVERKSWFPR